MKTFFPALAAATFLLCSCVETPPADTRFATTEDEERPGTLTILSDPPGALIQVNGKSIGRAPCTAEIPVQQANGKWMLQENLTVTALPAKDNEKLQTKVFEPFTAAPRQISFEFRNPGKSKSGNEEEFNDEWDRVTGGRSHELDPGH